MKSGCLKFIPKRELHHTRGAEGRRIFAKVAGVAEIDIGLRRIEADGVGEVENLPSKLQRVLFQMWNLEALGEAGINAENAVAANAVALASFAGHRVVVGSQSRTGLGEDVRSAFSTGNWRGRVFGGLRGGARANFNQLGDSFAR